MIGPDVLDGKPFLGAGVSLKELDARDLSFAYADRFDEKYDLVRTLHKGRFHYMRNYQPFNFDGLYNRYRYLQPAYSQWRELHKAGKLNAQQDQFFNPRPAECLYDLQADPDEVKNLADDPAYADVRREMRRLLQRQVKSMPDLSFIPEPVFLAEGKDNPAAYGQKKRIEIARLVDIADLSLIAFGQAKPQIARALDSDDPLERYWGLIVCSSFGREAACFSDRAQELAASDPSNLVRVRAAEFLGLTGTCDPRDFITRALERSTDANEVGLILNSVVLLQDGKPGYAFDLNPFFDSIQDTEKGRGEVVVRRMEYLRK